MYGENNWTLDRTRFKDEDPHSVDALGHTALQKVDILVSPDGAQHKAERETQDAERLHRGIEDFLNEQGNH